MLLQNKHLFSILLRCYNTCQHHQLSIQLGVVPTQQPPSLLMLPTAAVSFRQHLSRLRSLHLPLLKLVVLLRQHLYSEVIKTFVWVK